MKDTTAVRLALARRREEIALANYAGFSLDELLEETASLHQTLASCHQFGRSAELGLRHLIVDRLLEIDREHARRHPATWPTAA